MRDLEICVDGSCVRVLSRVRHGCIRNEVSTLRLLQSNSAHTAARCFFSGSGATTAARHGRAAATPASAAWYARGAVERQLVCDEGVVQRLAVGEDGQRVGRQAVRARPNSRAAPRARAWLLAAPAVGDACTAVRDLRRAPAVLVGAASDAASATRRASADPCTSTPLGSKASRAPRRTPSSRAAPRPRTAAGDAANERAAVRF